MATLEPVPIWRVNRPERTMGYVCQGLGYILATDIMMKTIETPTSFKKTCKINREVSCWDESNGFSSAECALSQTVFLWLLFPVVGCSRVFPGFVLGRDKGMSP